jgi:hypothetical protein
MAPVGLSRERRARFDGAAVDMHDAGAALAGIAADMGPGQVEVVAQEMHKKRAVLAIHRNRVAVYCEFDRRHVEPPGDFLIWSD